MDQPNWVKVERKGWDFSVNPEVVGVLVSKQKSTFEGNDYVLNNAVHGDVLIYGKTVLQNKLEALPIGTVVRILALGLKKNEKTKRTYEDFDVYYINVKQ